MPAVTRSAARSNAPRSRIEDPTPDGCSMTTRRTRSRNLRTTLKRKLTVNTEGGVDDEPARKKHETCIKSTIKTTTREKLRSTCHKSGDVEVITDNLAGKKASKRHLPSRIPQRCVFTRSAVNKKPNTANTNTMKSNITVGQQHNRKENKNDNNVNKRKEANSPTVETPDGVAARLKTYSAFCRSKQKKVNEKENATTRTIDESESPKSSVRGIAMSESDLNSRLVQEKEASNMNCEQENQDGSCNDDQATHKEIFNCDDEKEADEADLDAAGDDKSYYHKKYLDMVTRMKTLQEKFLKAQQNALRNSKVSDSLIDQLRISLETEMGNVCSAKEECQKKEKEIEKLQRAKQAISEKLLALTQQEKKDQEKDLDDSVDEEGLNEPQSKSKEQKALLKFYSTLTGISMMQDETHLNNSKFDSFHCEYRPENNKKHAVRFRLMYDREVGELEYCPNPKSPGSENLISNLPEYLQDNIFFSPNQAPRFLAKLLKNVEKL